MGFVTKAFFQTALPGPLRYVTSKFSRAKPDVPSSAKAENIGAKNYSSGGCAHPNPGNRPENQPASIKSKFLTGDKKPFLSTKRWFASCVEKKASVFVQKQQRKTETPYEQEPFPGPSSAQAFYSASVQNVNDGATEWHATADYEDDDLISTVPARVSGSTLTRDSTIIHTVQWGETLCSIARKYDADVVDIADFNDISDTDQIQYQTRLVIPGVQLLRIPQGQYQPVTWQRHYEQKLVDSARIQRRTSDRLPSKTKGRPAAVLVSQRTVSTIEPAPKPPVSPHLGMELVAASGVLATAMGCGILMSLMWNKVKSFGNEESPKGVAGREIKIKTANPSGKDDLRQWTQVVLSKNRSTFAATGPRTLKTTAVEEDHGLLERMHGILNDRTFKILRSSFSSTNFTLQRSPQSTSKGQMLAAPGGLKAFAGRRLQIHGATGQDNAVENITSRKILSPKVKSGNRPVRGEAGQQRSGSQHQSR
eukprot:TRINITY_DN149_c0_g1_i1.p1 TRINITY_DN149_c0_g1~~TRINITY_DN149_c0_g1_i1.p1  ORF type:complete len:479 (-),score=67.59 TRINITY_DN149_c0_g1_i1:373-1809(-)